MAEQYTPPTITWGPSAEHIGLPDARVAFMPVPIRGEDGKLVNAQAGFFAAELRPVYVIDTPKPWEKGQGRYPNGAKIAIEGVPGSDLTQADMHAAAYALARQHTPIPVDSRVAIPESRLVRQGHVEFNVPPSFLGPLRGQRLAEIALDYKRHREEQQAKQSEVA